MTVLVEAVVARYGVTDSHGRVIAPGCFTRSLERRLPVLTFMHELQVAFGHGVSFEDNDRELRVTFELDRGVMGRLWAERLRSGSHPNVSIGCWDVRWDRGVIVRMAEAELREVSLVTRGAMPGARVVSVVDRELVAA